MGVPQLLQASGRDFPSLCDFAPGDGPGRRPGRGPCRGEVNGAPAKFCSVPDASAKFW